ncbi:ion channel [Winogradskyella sp.]|jgi:hypothetical protein|uniref:ion channel n=1 Tax=Winogradskyella sp. TaxID=1883156 RepID=UPI0025F58B2E|nr:ion channel [Winogradskyella sp.]MCT4631046.1 potassium channel family protein [Winogradskyella sp.]
MKKTIKAYRFELFLFTLIFNLFGTLIFTDAFFYSYLFPISILLNILFGINLISNKKTKKVIIVLFIITAFMSGFTVLNTDNLSVDLLRFGFYFLFYVCITYEITKQIWQIKKVSKNLILGVISGYITLGLVGFFIFMTVEMAHPGSFDSVMFHKSITIDEKSNHILYYSFITLMTIGYGEIVPVTTIAQKAAILIGLLGQFYMVIITAFVVGKYINYSRK